MCIAFQILDCFVFGLATCHAKVGIQVCGSVVSLLVNRSTFVVSQRSFESLFPVLSDFLDALLTLRLLNYGSEFIIFQQRMAARCLQPILSILLILLLGLPCCI